MNTFSSSGKALAVALALASSTSLASASVFSYYANLDGPSESPPNASPGTGYATVDYDNVAKTLLINATFSGLIGTTTQAHIHGATAAPFTSTAGVAVTPGTLPGFPLGVTSGLYATTLDLTLTSTYTTGFLTANGGTAAGAEAGLAAAMASGRTYFNIHSSFAGGGEIRGFLTAVPEPGSLALLGLGGAALLFRRSVHNGI